ncbi:hypothetical protein SUGI_1090000 [Cryptomeria japonica]|nr:hypothetical protein SUGI_1090000 [Cryptomeria japonica]
MDCAMRKMCAVVSRASRPSTTLKVGHQLGVLGEGSCNALPQRAQPTASPKPRINTCLEKKLSYTTTSKHSKAGGLFVSTIAPAQPLLSLFLIHLSVDCGSEIYLECSFRPRANPSLLGCLLLSCGT